MTGKDFTFLQSDKVAVAASHQMRTLDGKIHPPPSQIKHQQQAKHSRRSFQQLQQQQQATI
jgi:hypothetical protein